MIRLCRGALAFALVAVSTPVIGQESISLEALGELRDLDPDKRFRLPDRLREVSGLAWHPAGYLLTHDDELGILYSIDPESGKIAGQAQLRDSEALGDYEGIAVLDPTTVLLTTSTGRLVRVDIESGASEAWSTGLDRECEIEGLAAADSGDEVLLVCKTLYRGSDDDALIVLRASASSGGPPPTVHMAISGDALRDADIPRPFLASGIEQVAGGYLIVSARRHRVLMVDRDGNVVVAGRLRESRHRQAEGITVDPEGHLWIADEGDGGRARLTRYPLSGGS